MIILNKNQLILSLRLAWCTGVRACEKCQPFCDSFNELFIKPITTSQELQASQIRHYLSQTYLVLIYVLVLPISKPKELIAANTTAVRQIRLLNEF